MPNIDKKHMIDGNTYFYETVNERKHAYYENLVFDQLNIKSNMDKAFNWTITQILAKEKGVAE